MKKVFTLLFITAYSCTLAIAQSKKPDAKAFAKNKDNFFAEKIGQRFPDIDPLTSLNGQPFYFSKINKPTMVYFGFAGCNPCHFAMPLLIKTAKEKKYKDYNFIYITFDNQKVVNEELKQDAHEIKDLKIMRMDRSLIQDDRLAFGYPTLYFINSDGTISYANGGGSTSDVFKTLQDWHTHLDALK